MALKEDIILQGVVFVFDVIKKLTVGLRKLLNKSEESRMKGLQIVKDMIGSNGTLANSSFVNNTLLNYIRENPVKSAGYVGAVSLLASAGIFAYNYAKKLIERYHYADTKAYNLIKHGSRPGSTPFLDYVYYFVHYWKQAGAQRNVFRTNFGYDLKRAMKLHRNAPDVDDAKVEYSDNGFKWRYLPLTAAATGVLGAAAIKYGSYLKYKRDANNAYQQAFLKANGPFLSAQEREQAFNSIDY